MALIFATKSLYHPSSLRVPNGASRCGPSAANYTTLLGMATDLASLVAIDTARMHRSTPSDTPVRPQISVL